MLTIGILKEVKNFENRVALCPHVVEKLTGEGISVFVERGAGEKSGFENDAYSAAGAELLPSAEKIFKNAQLLLKVQPVTPDEAELLMAGHSVFSFINFGQNNDRVLRLANTHGAYFSVELLMDERGVHPVLKAISELAGKMAIHLAATLLSVSDGGKGILIGGAQGTSPANITIIGSGLVGRVAAVQAWGTGANVTLLSAKPENLKEYDLGRDGLTVLPFSDQQINQLLPTTDVLIVAVHALHSSLNDMNISKKQIQLLKPGSIVMDLSVESTPVVETSHVTSVAQPTYISDGIVYYCVPNITSVIPVTTSKVYAANIFPYILILAKYGVQSAIKRSPELLSAIAFYRGKTTNRTLSERVGSTFYNIFELFDLNL